MLILTLRWVVILDILKLEVKYKLRVPQSAGSYSDSGLPVEVQALLSDSDSDSYSNRTLARSLSAWPGVARSHGVNDSYAPSPPLPAWLWFVLTCCGVAIAFRFRIIFKFRVADSDSYGEIQFQNHVQIHMVSSLQRIITLSKVMLSLFALVCASYCRTSDLDRCSRVCSCNNCVP